IKSGSLITARYAIEQNRDVYAVPGSPKSLNSQGCNYLIREGARLVGSIEDLIIDLHKDLNVSGLTLKGVADSAHDEAQNVSDAAQLVLSAVGSDTISFDDLFERLEMSFEHLSEHLLELELAGLISSVSGGYQLGS
ncbi:DNA-processing protein DprA, partial [Oleiphilus sp. HI0066]